MCCLRSIAQSLTRHLLDRGVQLQDDNVILNHLTKFCLSCPDKLSAQSDSHAYPKAFPIGSYWCHSYFQALLTPASEISGDWEVTQSV